LHRLKNSLTSILPAKWQDLWKEMKRSRNAYLFIAPFYVIFALFMVFPISFSLYLSFLHWNGIMEPQPAGWANYQKALRDPSLHNAIMNTAVFTLLSVTFSVMLGLAIALYLNSVTLLKRLYRCIFFIPSIISLVVVALVWKLILNSEVGLINESMRMLCDGLGQIGVHIPLWMVPECHFLDHHNPLVPLLTIVLVNVWANVGFSTVIFLAGLQGIPSHLYDVSRIDGATRYQNLWHITLPLLRPTMFFVVFISAIDALQMFVLPNVMNGDSESTMTIVCYLYRNAFEFYKMGYASAIAYLLFGLTVCLSLGIRLIFGRDARWAVLE
jgi:multiple sugar transport system permease protein